jgi:hypothetical protein
MFDNTTYCNSAVYQNPVGADWSIDIDASEDDAVWIEIAPQAIDGGAAGGLYRVKAGAIYDFRPSQTCSNDKYQYFGVHTYNSGTGLWENFAWFILGHMDENGVALVGRVAPGGTCWGSHVHMEGYNYSYYSRTYDWDGPTNNDDDDFEPPCTRSGAQTDDECNAYMKSTDILGYVGGTKRELLR